MPRADAAPAPRPAPAPAPAGIGAKTMVGFAAPSGLPPAAPTPAATRPNKAASTMVGLSAADVFPPAPQATQAPQAAPPPPADRGAASRTIVGMAAPGIAPAPPAQAAPLPPMRGEHPTMLGVAMPGIAPIGPGAEPPSPAPDPAPPPRRARVAPAKAIPPIVAAPPPLVHDEPLPQPPALRPKRGLSLAVVAGGAFLLAATAGVLVYFFWKAGPPLVVKPQAGPLGNEQLLLRCETCPDGTVASVLEERATFQAKQALIDLKTPLRLGDNPMDIRLDRPNAMGRDETVKATVPVFYRVRADLSEIDAPVPVILVRVEAVAGTRVRVDGHELTLDAEGKGSHAIDIRADTDGASDEGKILERTIPYEVTPPKTRSSEPPTERGEVTARVGVVPLHIDAPSALSITDKNRFTVAGRTAKGATVSVNGRPLESSTGVFAQTFELPKLGDTAVEVRSSAPQVAPRTARLTVRRVEKLETEAKDFEASSPLSYDAVRADIAGHVGQRFAVEGEVFEARTLNHQTVALVADRRCTTAKTSPCLVRILHGGDLALRPRDTVRAYGLVTKAFAAPDGTTVPEVEASFVLVGKPK